MTVNLPIVPDLNEYFFNSVDLLSVFTKTSKIGITNPAWKTVLGWDLENLKEMGFIELVHPDDIERTHHQSNVEWAGAESEFAGFENRMRCKDGSYKWIEWTSRRRGDLIYATGRDVTRRRKVLLQLDQYIEQTKAIFAAATDAIIVVQRDLTIVDMNPAAQHIFGDFHGVRIGQFGVGILHPDDRPSLLRVMRGIFDTNEIASARFRARNVEGEWRTFEARGHVMGEESGSPSGAVFITRDITAAVEEEAALGDSLRKLAAVVATAVDEITIIDRDMNVVDTTAWTQSSSNQSLVVELTRNVLTRIHPDDQAVAIEAGRRIFEEGRTESVRVRYLHPDGQWLTMESRGRALVDATGPPLTAVFTSRDITEEVLAGKILALSLETTNAIIDSAVDVISLIDRDLTIIESSAAVEHLLGRTHESRRGRHVLEFMHPDDREIATTALREAFEDNGHVNFRARMLNADGRTIIIEVRGRTLRDVPGPATRLVFIARDITDAVAAEVALARSVEQTHAILDAVADSIVVIDHNLLIQEISPSNQRIYGYPIESRIGGDSLAHVHSLDLSHVASSLNHLFSQQSDQISDFRFRARHADGHWLTMETRARLIQEVEGEVPRAVLVTRDVTETMERDHALERAKTEAERANSAKSEFLSRMSHELRTPLNSVLGFAQLLQMESGSADDIEIADQIYRSGQHLLRLINEVLEISRIESGSIAVSLESFELNEVVEECIRLVTPQGSSQNVNFINLSDEYPSVVADRNRVHQIIINLLSNAIKYNKTDGTVTISYELGKKRLRLLVADTGHGIAPELIDRLFTPFDRLGTETSGIEGTGLGLALSKSLAEAMGGTLTLMNSSKSGCTFALELNTP